ncbi:MAG: fumarylacetoacetate hydrolase family protein [Bacteroidia bacterium]|jgi:fumarylacetoacetate (FAA) hydrolase|nr:fumarylacetoacetate hydrolase family protein [Bacteroidia bacterium]
MKLVTYTHQKTTQLGIIHEGKIWSLKDLDAGFPDKMRKFLFAGEAMMNKAKRWDEQIKAGKVTKPFVLESEVQLEAPVPQPTSCRDGYAFRQHVAAARRNRGVEMIKEFDQYPIFYFTNHNAVQGPGTIPCMPDHFDKLDFELEVAVVIGKKGRNIKAAQADEYIAGYMIMNDMSARTLQMEEMLLNLGPAKGKDFSTVIGPYFVTPDELEQFVVAAKPGHTGKSHNLTMKCWVNGIQVSEGNVADMDWTFAEIIERCAYGVDILPGDVIGSGTVGTGCFLELNGTGLLNDKNFVPQWLQPGDEVTLEITGLGKLTNTIERVETDFSLLKMKK